MEATTTANQLSGRATGSIFFSAFGALWITLALYIRHMLSPEFAALTVGVAVGLGVLLLTAFWLIRQAKRFPRMPEDPAVNRSFNRINAYQWIAVGIVAFGFARLHIDVYVLSAITAIVGIHMFPLASLFRYPMHHVTGAALVVWASASVLFIPREHLQAYTALGTGSILWLSAAVTLFLAARLALRSRISPSLSSTSICI